MTSSEYLAGYSTRADALLERVRLSLGKLDVEQWNAPVPDWPWSLAQILEHVHLSHVSYLAPVDLALRHPVEGDGPIRHSWVGRFLLNQAGPTGNAPAPPAFVPPKGPYDRLVLERFEDTYRRFQDLVPHSQGCDLSRTKIRNPLLPFLVMNLADVFELSIQHGDRHVQQIERFVPKVIRP